MYDPKVPVSVGEALDKLTILEIKEEKLTDKASLALVRDEGKKITAALTAAGVSNETLSGSAVRELYYVNLALWEVEDQLRASRGAIREHLAAVTDFTDLAEAVPDLNRKRFECKARLNEQHGSSIREVKQYHGEGEE